MGKFLNNIEAELDLRRVQNCIKRNQINEAVKELGVLIQAYKRPEDIQFAAECLSRDTLVCEIREEDLSRLIMLMIMPLDAWEEIERRNIQELCLKRLNEIDLEDYTARMDMSDLHSVKAMLLRHMAQPGEALKEARIGLESYKIPYCAIFAGLCYLDMDRLEDAESYFQKSVELDPKNMSGYNDLGDYLLQRGDYKKAEFYYGEIAKFGDMRDREWGEPSWLFCRYINHKGLENKERLVGYAAAYLDNTRAAELCERMRDME